MLVILAVSGKFSATFISSVRICPVYADDADTNRISSLFLELRNLLLKVRADPIELFSHRFRKDFYFRADLDRGHLAKCNRDSRDLIGYVMRNASPKGCVSSASFLSYSAIGRIQYTAL